MKAAAARRQAQRADQTAERVAESTAADRLAQIGLLARAAVVFTIAVVTFEIVRGGSNRPADTRGALQTLAATPVGVVLLVVLAAAFAGHAVWRFLEAATGLHRDTGERRNLKRLGFACVGVLYLALCITTIRVVAGRGGDSENAESHKATSDLLGLPGGRVLTFVVGVAILGVAIGVAAWALGGRFLIALHVEQLSPGTRAAVRWLGAAGQTARAGVIGVAAFLFIHAAVESNGSQAQGLDGTLRTIAGRPYGSVLLTVTGIGLVVFGIYSVVEALLRRTSHDEASRQPDDMKRRGVSASR